MMDSKACVLLMNDIHVSKGNIAEFRKNWREALELCSKLGIREIVTGGDLFQSRAAQTLDVLLGVRDVLIDATKQYGITVTLANGNHDKVDEESFKGYCHVFEPYEGVYVVEDYLTLYPTEDCDFALHVVAYFPENGGFMDVLTGLIEHGLDPVRKNILYIHEGINGALSASTEKELSPNLFKDFDAVLSGHYHDRCRVEPNIEFIGSSRQHNFGEDEDKGYTVICNDGSYYFVKNEVNLRYRVMDVSFEQLGVHFYDLLEGLKDSGRYRVKVRVHCRDEQVKLIDKQLMLDAGATRVEVVAEEIIQQEAAAKDVLSKFDGRQLTETYMNFCDEKRIEDTSLGIYYLSQVGDGCGD